MVDRNHLVLTLFLHFSEVALGTPEFTHVVGRLAEMRTEWEGERADQLPQEGVAHRLST